MSVPKMIKTRVTSSSQLLKKIAGFTFMLDNYLKNENYNLDLGERVKSFPPCAPRCYPYRKMRITTWTLLDVFSQLLQLQCRILVSRNVAHYCHVIMFQFIFFKASLAISACWLMLAKHMRNCLLIQERPTIHARNQLATLQTRWWRFCY